MISPQNWVQEGKSTIDVGPGCSYAAFDASSTLLASQLDESPSTIWIWDVQAGELRAALLFHSSISFSWHPSVRELLLVTCREDSHWGTFFIWDPLSDGPMPVNVFEYLPQTNMTKKRQLKWVNLKEEPPLLFISDPQTYTVLSLNGPGEELTPVQNQTASELPSSAGTGEYSLHRDDDTRDLSTLIPDDSILDDTFSFKAT